MLCSFLASILSFYFIVCPVVDMKDSLNESSEIVSQAYFSEEVTIIEKLPDWTHLPGMALEGFPMLLDER